MKLFDYIKGKRRGEEAQRIELEAMRDPLLGDAIEGFDKVPGNHGEALERLARRISERSSGGDSRITARTDLAQRRQRRLRNWSVATGAAVLAGLTIGTLVYVLREDPLGQPTVAHEVRSGELTEYDTPIILSPPAEAVEAAVTAEAKASSKTGEERKVADQQQLLSDYINIVGNDSKISTQDVDFPDFSDELIVELPVLVEETVDDIPAYSATDIAVNERTRAQRAFSGRVVDAESGEPLPGVVVTEEYSGTTAITDHKGNFTLPEAVQNTGIRANRLGYDEGIATADTAGQMLIAMAPSQQAPDEAVAVGYGTVEKKSAAGSVSKSRPALSPADTTITPLFRQYLAGERERLLAEGFSAGWAILEFRVDKKGRPERIRLTESSSPEAAREARRLLREGPGWEPSERKRRITILF